MHNLWSQRCLRTEPGVVLLAFVELRWIYIKVNEISPLGSLASSLERGYNLIWSLKHSNFGQQLPLPSKLYTPNPWCTPRSWVSSFDFMLDILQLEEEESGFHFFTSTAQKMQEIGSGFSYVMDWLYCTSADMMIKDNLTFLGENQQLVSLQKNKFFPKKISP